MSHAIDRAWERYGLRLDTRDLAAIRSLIQSGSPLVVKLRDVPPEYSSGAHESLRDFVAWHAGRAVGVTVNPQGWVVTFLPRELISRFYGRQARQVAWAGKQFDRSARARA